MTRKIVRSFVGWLVLTVLFAVLAVWGNTVAGKACLLMWILFPIITCLLNIMVRKKLRIDIKMPSSAAKDEEVPIVITVRNQSILPITGIYSNIRVENQLTGEEKEIFLTLSAISKGETEKEVRICSGRCGYIRVKVSRIYLMDWFGFLPIPVSVDGMGKLSVLPDTFSPKVYLNMAMVNCMDSDSWSQDRRGPDPAEVFALRDYKEGESLKQIHWKLSSKRNQLIVKEASLPIEKSLLIFWDKNAGTATPEQMDAMAECVASLGQEIAGQGVPFTIGWTDGRTNQYEDIDSQEQMLQINPDMGRTADSIQRNIHRMLYDDRVNAMPEGNLSNLSGLEKSEKTALKMKMEQPQKLYLRGKTLEVYTGNAWEPYAAETRIEHEDLFYWLHKTGFYGQNMISNAASLEEKVEKAKLTVENVSACEEHPYLPYAISEDSYLDVRGIGDDTGYAGSKNVEMTYLPGSVPQWYQLAVYLSGHQEEEKVQEYLKQEQSYREFVYENDLQITDRAVGVCKQIWGEDESSRSLPEILDLVRDTLNKRLKYDENTKTANGKNDFFAYTMEQNKSGYSVHYATAATLMLRYLGVPARYVEGYYLSTEEAQQYQKNQEIDLTEAHAHAWTEYYMDGVGWIPFEVTPGYIEKEEIDLLGDMMTKDVGTHSGKSYSQNQKALSYTPPKSQQEQQQKPDVRNQFRFQARQVVSMILVIIVLVLLATVVWILRRRYRLQKFRKMIEESDHRTVILELYSYTGMLKRRCGIEMSGREEEISSIYQEARFSNHDLNDEKAGIMRQYTDEVISACMTHCGHLAKLWYKYVLWIFDSKKYFI